MFVVFPPSIAILGLFDTRKKYKIGYQRKKYKRINEDLSKTILEEESFQKYLKVYVEKI